MANAQSSIVKVNHNFQVTIPVPIRRKYDIEEGDLIEARETREGILLKPKLLLDKLPNVELSKKGEKMLKEAIEDFKTGRYKQFENVEDLIEDLHK
jgi:AbrB family looped-hinge helix DNA binding protein